MCRLRELAKCCRGGTVIEYGLICALIVIAILGSIHVFAGNVVGLFTHVQNEVTNSTEGL